MDDAWYRLSGEEINSKLSTSAEGLSAAEAQSRLQQFGPNEIEFQKIPEWLRFLRQFNDPMVIILLVTAIVTGTLTAMGSHMLPDTIVIFAVVILNAVLGFVQEGKAEGALDALRGMMVQEALVIRDGGGQHRVPARDLVPGDLVVLEGGDKIPADVRFVETSNIHVDESSLTGESVPVKKHDQALSGHELVPGDQSNMGFSGTYVTMGTARGVVVETGAGTTLGHIAQMVREAATGLTPLQLKMKEFVHTLIIAILIVGAFNFVYGIYLGYSTAYSFLGAVSLVVAAIPEMLPALVTSILALSGVVMAGRKALIRKLPAAETLGATSVICSDKTGTLTENRMTVTRLYSAGRILDVTGTGFEIEGKFLDAGRSLEAASDPALMRLLTCGFYCNNAHLSGGGGSGDPTELALRISGSKAGLAVDGVQRLVELPFDSASKYMAVLVETEGGRFILAKGAPEVLTDMCASELAADGSVSAFNIDVALGSASAFARDALRTLAFAIKPVGASCDELGAHDLVDMTFVGLQGMIDPPKTSAIEAMAQCSRAGIRTVMITGDHPETAQAVAKQLGIEADAVVTGAELSQMDPTDLRKTVETVSVFARVAPEHKQAIAQALQSHGLVVAMTGDGVNDAPALKAADIGVAMGISGTEVAKESADMVLADDNFASIVAAVEEGRHAWNNLQKAILYTLPTNAAQALLIMGAVLMAAFMPIFATRFVLEPVQILWINLLDSILLTLPLMMEPKEKGLLDVPPRPAKTHIINSLFLQRVMVMGLAIAVPGFLVYYHFGNAAIVDGELVDPLLLTQAQTAAFWAILLAHDGYVISARSIHGSFFKLNPFSNRWLLFGIGLGIVLRLIPTFFPEVGAVFRIAAFPLEWWPLVLACFFPAFVAIELDKLLRRVFSENPPDRRQPVVATDN